ncbi:glycerophosphodiester phosphodiesterase family protein [Ignavigranum ruoffiae]|uniref:glycerophosphodiester phosphodiesterase family protein n=1 Tax=Ignavigranum ruoffiae TaxID=89093 RepID=UPI0020607C22|nr:glycerophosphodiester phosphodiesterase family protein [Ignavigranum ruoffiae]UPQ85041.1 glycerophosphodiester phosphodiesterase family protein [Ignavigranum ruoffiae]
MTNKENNILKLKREKVPFLICGHRGQWGGNIIQNTVNSGILACRFGSDIFELDVAKSSDDIFFCFHTKAEKEVFGQDFDLESLTFAEIQGLNPVNRLLTETNQKIESLKTLLDKSPESLFFQLDRCYSYLTDLLPFLDQFPKSIRERLIIKIPFNIQAMEILDSSPYDFMTMVIIDDKEQLEVLEKYTEINFIGIEIIAKNSTNNTYGKEVIDYIHQKLNLLVQLNALKLSDKYDLYAGHDDDVSLLEGADKGWGTLYSLGADIIQTDWSLALDQYRSTLRSNIK